MESHLHELTVVVFFPAGFAVYSLDHISHGKSVLVDNPVMGLIPAHTMLTNDYFLFAEKVRKLHPEGTPTFLVGHSMGTLVSLRCAGAISGLKALALSGCALVCFVVFLIFMLFRPGVGESADLLCLLSSLFCSSIPAFHQFFMCSVFFSAWQVPGPHAASPFGCTCCYPITKTSCAVSLAKCLAGCDGQGPWHPRRLKNVGADEISCFFFSSLCCVCTFVILITGHS